MTIFGDLILAIAKILNLIIDMVTFIVVIAVVMSWFRPDPMNPIVRVIYQVTQPIFNWVRRYMPRVLFRMGIDLTPLVVLLLLIFIESFLIKQIWRLGMAMT